MNIALEVKNISKKYKNFTLKNVSFQLEKGTITGFIGENGAGKTTTMSSIMNLIKVDSGQILIEGKPVKGIKDLRNVSYLESNRDLYPDVTMDEYKYFISHVYKKSWSEEKYKEYTEKFHIENNKKIKELSTGMKAKFYLAVELARQPELLILDEPTSGLDPLARNELLEIIKQLAERENMTIFFSSHITSDIEHVAGKVVFIHNGEILLDMDKKEISSSFKKVSNEELNKMTSSISSKIDTCGVKNFDYYIVNNSTIKDCDDYKFKDASLDDVLMYLTGGVKIA